MPLAAKAILPLGEVLVVRIRATAVMLARQQPLEAMVLPEAPAL